MNIIGGFYMRNKHYNILVKVVDVYLGDINTHFLSYNIKF